MYSRMFRFGCIEIRSDKRNNPEYTLVECSISNAATIAFPLSHRTSINSMVLFVASSNCVGKD